MSVHTLAAEQVTEPIAGHGEGPVWCPADERLRWVDMLAGDLLALDPGSGAVSRTKVSSVLAVVRPRAGGGLVLAVERGFALMDADGALRVLPELWSSGPVRMNDGGCDARGRFYAGSIAVGEHHGQGSLYRLDPQTLGATPVLEGVTVSNGLAFSRDGGTAFYVDTDTRRIDIFAVNADGELTRRRPFVTIPAAQGHPDGLCLDAQGGVWVALWDGGAVHRYGPDGELDTVVTVPVDRPTACCFGGPDLGDLYITTSRPGSDDPTPAGALFRVRPGVTGFPDHTFAG
jgi:sugar lactone lactonase YvrE